MGVPCVADGFRRLPVEVEKPNYSTEYIVGFRRHNQYHGADSIAMESNSIVARLGISPSAGRRMGLGPDRLLIGCVLARPCILKSIENHDIEQ